MTTWILIASIAPYCIIKVKTHSTRRNINRTLPHGHGMVKHWWNNKWLTIASCLGWYHPRAWCLHVLAASIILNNLEYMLLIILCLMISVCCSWLISCLTPFLGRQLFLHHGEQTSALMMIWMRLPPLSLQAGSPYPLSNLAAESPLEHWNQNASIAESRQW